MTAEYNDLAFLNRQETSMAIAFREVAAQIMRYARGAGDSNRLMKAVVEAAKYAEVMKVAPALGEAALGQLRDWRNTSEVRVAMRPEEFATIDACEGALQLVASRIAGDHATEPRGAQQLKSAARRLEELEREFLANLQK